MGGLALRCGFFGEVVVDVVGDLRGFSREKVFWMFGGPKKLLLAKTWLGGSLGEKEGPLGIHGLNQDPQEAAVLSKKKPPSKAWCRPGVLEVVGFFQDG